MELSCTENISVVNYAQRDPVIFSDNRVVENLLNDEALYIPSCDYFSEVQVDIQPYMRNVVATWMMEVKELNVNCNILKQYCIIVFIYTYFLLKAKLTWKQKNEIYIFETNCVKIPRCTCLNQTGVCNSIKT